MPRPHCTPLPKLTEKDIERFWKYVRKNPDCWIWTGFTMTPDFYGQLSINNRHWLVPRLAWMINKGEDPGDRLVLHTCDIPLCVNPDHLFLGDDRLNWHDREKKGRQVRRRIGEKNPSAKLTDAQVIKIRETYDPSIPMKVIATKHNVSIDSIWRIVRNKGWKHLLPKGM